MIMINYSIIFISGIFLGIIIMWIATRPEPEKEVKSEICHAYEDFGDKVDVDAWKDCMNECTAYTFEPDIDEKGELKSNSLVKKPKSSKKKRKK